MVNGIMMIQWEISCLIRQLSPIICVQLSAKLISEFLWWKAPSRIFDFWGILINECLHEKTWGIVANIFEQNKQKYFSY